MTLPVPIINIKDIQTVVIYEVLLGQIARLHPR